VLVALPVDHKFDTPIGDDPSHDLIDEQTDQALLGAIVSSRIGPNCWKALRQSEQTRPIRYWLTALFALYFGQTAIEFSDPSQGLVPAPLQGLSDKPVLRLNRVVLALGPSSLIARFFEFESERACYLVGLLGDPLRGVNCCFDRARSKYT
jgi:hypothetical protein